MTALTASYEDKRQDGEIVSVPVKGSTKIYKGAMVVDLGTGYASVGADTSGAIMLGVAVETADNSANATDGAISVRVYKTGVFQYSKASAVQTDLDQLAYIRDDNTVALSTTNSVSAGYIVSIVDGSTVKLRIDQVAR
jgi:hypothetical protein